MDDTNNNINNQQLLYSYNDTSSTTTTTTTTAIITSLAETLSQNFSNLSSSSSGTSPQSASTILISSEAADAQALLVALNQMYKYIATPVILFGICTNILTLLTLRDPELKKAPYSYLTALAVADLSALLLALSLYVTQFLEDYIDKWSYEYCWYKANFYYPLINLATTSGTFIMTTMTIERCLFIKFPFWVLAHKSRARFKIGCVFVASFLINFPRFLWYYPIQIARSQPGSNASIAVGPVTDDAGPGNFSTSSTSPSSSSSSSNEGYMIGPHLHGTHFAMAVSWTYSVILHCLPVVSLILLNAFIIYKFRFEHRRRSELGISSTMSTVWGREQTRLTYTYSIITGAFIVFIMPSAFSDENISKALFGANRQTPSIVILQFVSNFLVCVNLSVNFLMYTFINVKITRAFKTMMLRWRMRARSVLFCCTLESRRRARARREQFKMTMASEEKVPFNNNKNGGVGGSGRGRGDSSSSSASLMRKQYKCGQMISRNVTSFTTLSESRSDVI